MTSALASQATAVLLDPEVSAAQAIASHTIPGNVGLVVAVESTGYTGDATARQAQIIPGWSVEKAKRMGASAIKLLVYYHPDSPTATEIEDFTSKIAEECRKQDLVLMLEPLSYSLDENKKQWAKAVNKDKIKWTQVNDDGGWESQTALQWGLYYIPASYLIDRNGRLIARDPEIKDLEKILEELLK